MLTNDVNACNASLCYFGSAGPGDQERRGPSSPGVRSGREEKEIPLLEAPQDAVSPSSPPSKTRNCLRKPLKKGEVLVYSNLERPDLDMVLAPGSRAVSIRMDAAPDVLPGMRCDLLHKERRDGKDQEPKVLLTGARVQAIDRAHGHA